jgi:hypothetical protein
MTTLSDVQLVEFLNYPAIITGGLVPKGAYNAGTDYAVGDSVDYNGSSYVMFNNAGAGTLPTNTTYWQVVANKGDTGAAGASGSNGADGVDGDVYTTATQTGTTRNETATSSCKVILCDCTSNAITVNLPTAVGNTAKFEIKKIDSSANAVTVDAFSTQTIDGGLTAVLQVQYESITIVTDGANWFLI